MFDIGASDLKTAYERLNTEFQSAEAAAQQVADRIDKVEAVAGALFDEWEQELDLYRSENLRRASRAKFEDTRRRYADMLAAMRRAEQRMAPVLDSFRDNVLFLKHNLNAQAVGALQGEVVSIERDVARLVEDMTRSIREAEAFLNAFQ